MGKWLEILCNNMQINNDMKQYKHPQLSEKCKSKLYHLKPIRVVLFLKLVYVYV